MAAEFRAHIMTQTPQAAQIILEGALNEDVNNLPSCPKADSIQVDLEKITMINSVGIRTWIGWLAQFPADQKVIFTNMPSTMVSQMNVVKDFIPQHMRVVSILIPYACENCGADFVTKLDISQLKISSFQQELAKIKETPCPQCQQQAELDAVPERYFAFVKTNPQFQ